RPRIIDEGEGAPQALGGEARVARDDEGEDARPPERVERGAVERSARRDVARREPRGVGRERGGEHRAGGRLPALGEEREEASIEDGEARLDLSSEPPGREAARGAREDGGEEEHRRGEGAEH